MTPTCRQCGSTAITVTSSQQMVLDRRKGMEGRKRQAADAICEHCGNQWWSVSRAIRALARAADKARTA